MPLKNRKIVVVESPTKAKTLSKYLKGYEILASYGHIRDLPKSELGIDLEHDFKPHYIIPRDKRKRVNAFKKSLEGKRWIYLATDPDREGEAIAWHIAELVKEMVAGKSREIKRVAFHEITAEAIQKAFKEPRLIDLPLVCAQQARRVLDRIVGYRLSPLLWQKVKRGLSAGRVQSVAVRLIVEREEEIRAFKPQEYWNLKAIFQTQDGASFEAQLIKKNDKPINLKNESTVNEILAELKQSAFEIAEVQEKQVSKNPSPPFMTSTLERQASNFGFSAKRTMQAAQSLYEQGYITYMRTDSLNLAESFLRETRSLIEKDFGGKFLPPKPKYYKSQAKVSQEAHEAIRPTNPFFRSDADVKVKLSRDEFLIYSLIWKKAVASQMMPALFNQTTVDINSQKLDGVGTNYLFRAIGRQLEFKGYFALYPEKEEANGEKEEEILLLPKLSSGQKLKVKEFLPQQKFTEPPARFTEGSLIKALEDYGIGRPSTYAPIISTIQERYYVEKIEKKFFPTKIGETVNKFLFDHFPDLLNYDFTARMEENLDEIARGKEKWVEVVRAFYVPFEKLYNQVYENAQKVEVELEKSSEICEKCGKPMVVRVGRFGKFLACSGFPECKNTKPLVKKTDLKCPQCGDDIVLKRTRRGKVFYGCSNYPKCSFASWRKPTQKGTTLKETES